MVARHGRQEMGWRAGGRWTGRASVLRTGALGDGGRGTTRAGCACGEGQTASNRGGQGGLHMRGELPERTGAATGQVHVLGGEKKSEN
jgi:hypothetical protein